MTPEIKFCGMMRREDAVYAAELGAAYVGVIFAGGPRQLTPERACDVLRDVPRDVRRVGVFGDDDAVTIATMATHLGLDVVQLHGITDPDRVRSLRAAFQGHVWAVVRLVSAALPPQLSEIASHADAVLFDAYVPGALGGTGVPLPWMELADVLRPFRDAQATRVVLAGGLRPDNVADAVTSLGPDVVDVSSGVERSPGVKDHDRMRAFRDAVTAVSHLI